MCLTESSAGRLRVPAGDIEASAMPAIQVIVFFRCPPRERPGRVVVFVRGIDTINQTSPEEIKSAPPGFLAPWSSRALQARGPTAGLLCHGLKRSLPNGRSCWKCWRMAISCADTLLQPCQVRVSAHQRRASRFHEAGMWRYQRIAPRCQVGMHAGAGGDATAFRPWRRELDRV